LKVKDLVQWLWDEIPECPGYSIVALVRPDEDSPAHFEEKAILDIRVEDTPGDVDLVVDILNTGSEEDCDPLEPIELLDRLSELLPERSDDSVFCGSLMTDAVDGYRFTLDIPVVGVGKSDASRKLAIACTIPDGAAESQE